MTSSSDNKPIPAEAKLTTIDASLTEQDRQGIQPLIAEFEKFIEQLQLPENQVEFEVCSAFVSLLKSRNNTEINTAKKTLKELLKEEFKKINDQETPGMVNTIIEMISDPELKVPQKDELAKEIKKHEDILNKIVYFYAAQVSNEFRSFSDELPDDNSEEKFKLKAVFSAFANYHQAEKKNSDSSETKEALELLNNLLKKEFKAAELREEHIMTAFTRAVSELNPELNTPENEQHFFGHLGTHINKFSDAIKETSRSNAISSEEPVSFEDQSITPTPEEKTPNPESQSVTPSQPTDNTNSFSNADETLQTEVKHSPSIDASTTEPPPELKRSPTENKSVLQSFFSEENFLPSQVDPNDIDEQGRLKYPSETIALLETILYSQDKLNALKEKINAQTPNKEAHVNFGEKSHRFTKVELRKIWNALSEEETKGVSKETFTQYALIKTPPDAKNTSPKILAIYKGKNQNKALGSGAFGTAKLVQELNQHHLPPNALAKWKLLKVSKPEDTTKDKSEAAPEKKKSDEFTIGHKMGLLDDEFEHKSVDDPEKKHTHKGRRLNHLMKLAPGSILGQEEATEAKKNLSQQQWFSVLISILTQMAAIHEKNIIHRDIKLTNIIYDPTLNICNFVDYGLSLQQQNEEPVEAIIQGTSSYIDPHSLTQAEAKIPKDHEGHAIMPENGYLSVLYTPASDIFSLGVVFAKMLRIVDQEKEKQYQDKMQEANDIAEQKLTDEAIINKAITQLYPSHLLENLAENANLIKAFPDEKLRREIVSILASMTNPDPIQRQKATDYLSQLKKLEADAKPEPEKIAVIDINDFFNKDGNLRSDLFYGVKSLNAFNKIIIADPSHNYANKPRHYAILRGFLQRNDVIVSDKIYKSPKPDTQPDTILRAVTEIKAELPNDKIQSIKLSSDHTLSLKEIITYIEDEIWKFSDNADLDAAMEKIFNELQHIKTNLSEEKTKDPQEKAKQTREQLIEIIEYWERLENANGLNISENLTLALHNLEHNIQLHDEIVITYSNFYSKLNNNKPNQEQSAQEEIKATNNRSKQANSTDTDRHRKKIKTSYATDEIKPLTDAFSNLKKNIPNSKKLSDEGKEILSFTSNFMETLLSDASNITTNFSKRIFLDDYGDGTDAIKVNATNKIYNLLNSIYNHLPGDEDISTDDKPIKETLKTTLELWETHKNALIGINKYLAGAIFYETTKEEKDKLSDSKETEFSDTEKFFIEPYDDEWVKKHYIQQEITASPTVMQNEEKRTSLNADSPGEEKAKNDTTSTNSSTDENTPAETLSSTVIDDRSTTPATTPISAANITKKDKKEEVTHASEHQIPEEKEKTPSKTNDNTLTTYNLVYISYYQLQAIWSTPSIAPLKDQIISELKSVLENSNGVILINEYNGRAINGNHRGAWITQYNQMISYLQKLAPEVQILSPNEWFNYYTLDSDSPAKTIRETKLLEEKEEQFRIDNSSQKIPPKQQIKQFYYHPLRYRLKPEEQEILKDSKIGLITHDNIGLFKKPAPIENTISQEQKTTKQSSIASNEIITTNTEQPVEAPAPTTIVSTNKTPKTEEISQQDLNPKIPELKPILENITQLATKTKTSDDDTHNDLIRIRNNLLTADTISLKQVETVIAKINNSVAIDITEEINTLLYTIQQQIIHLRHKNKGSDTISYVEAKKDISTDENAPAEPLSSTVIYRGSATSTTPNPVAQPLNAPTQEEQKPSVVPQNEEKRSPVNTDSPEEEKANSSAIEPKIFELGSLINQLSSLAGSIKTKMGDENKAYQNLEQIKEDLLIADSIDLTHIENSIKTNCGLATKERYIPGAALYLGNINKIITNLKSRPINKQTGIISSENALTRAEEKPTIPEEQKEQPSITSDTTNPSLATTTEQDQATAPEEKDEQDNSEIKPENPEEDTHPTIINPKMPELKPIIENLLILANAVKEDDNYYEKIINTTNELLKTTNLSLEKLATFASDIYKKVNQELNINQAAYTAITQQINLLKDKHPSNIISYKKRAFSEYFIPPQIKYEHLHYLVSHEDKRQEEEALAPSLPPKAFLSENPAEIEEKLKKKATKHHWRFTGKERDQFGITDPYVLIRTVDEKTKVETIYQVYFGKKHDEEEKEQKNPHKHLIGEGTFGKLKAILNTRTGEWYALKTQNKLQGETQASLEATVLKQLGESLADFTHIPDPIREKEKRKPHKKTNSTQEKEKQKNILMNFYKGTDIDIFLGKHRDLALHKRIKLAAKMAFTAAEFFKKGFIHGDIKPPNFMYDASTDEMKIIDFGDVIERKGHPSSHKFSPLRNYSVGTPGYAAPQILDGTVWPTHIPVGFYKLNTDDAKSSTPEEDILAHIEKTKPSLSMYYMKDNALYFYDIRDERLNEVKPLPPHTFSNIQALFRSNKIDDLSDNELKKIEAITGHNQWKIQSVTEERKILLLPVSKTGLYIRNTIPDDKNIKDISSDRAYIYSTQDKFLYFINKARTPSIKKINPAPTLPLSTRLTHHMALISQWNREEIEEKNFHPITQSEHDELLNIAAKPGTKLSSIYQMDTFDIDASSDIDELQGNSNNLRAYVYAKNDRSLYFIDTRENIRQRVNIPSQEFIARLSYYNDLYELDWKNQQGEISTDLTDQQKEQLLLAYGIPTIAPHFTNADKNKILTDAKLLPPVLPTNKNEADRLIEKLFKDNYTDRSANELVAIHNTRASVYEEFTEIYALAKSTMVVLGIANISPDQTTIDLDEAKARTLGLPAEDTNSLIELLKNMQNPEYSPRLTLAECAEKIALFYPAALKKTEEKPYNIAIIDLNEFLFDKTPPSVGSAGYEEKRKAYVAALKNHEKGLHNLLLALEKYNEVIVVSEKDTSENLVGSAFLRNLLVKHNIIVRDKIFENTDVNLSQGIVNAVSEIKQTEPSLNFNYKIITKNGPLSTLNTFIELEEKWKDRPNFNPVEITDAIRVSLQVQLSFDKIMPFINKPVFKTSQLASTPPPESKHIGAYETFATKIASVLKDLQNSSNKSHDEFITICEKIDELRREAKLPLYDTLETQSYFQLIHAAKLEILDLLPKKIKTRLEDLALQAEITPKDIETLIKNAEDLLKAYPGDYKKDHDILNYLHRIGKALPDNNGNDFRKHVYALGQIKIEKDLQFDKNIAKWIGKPLSIAELAAFALREEKSLTDLPLIKNAVTDSKENLEEKFNKIINATDSTAETKALINAVEFCNHNIFALNYERKHSPEHRVYLSLSDAMITDINKRLTEKVTQLYLEAQRIFNNLGTEQKRAIEAEKKDAKKTIKQKHEDALKFANCLKISEDLKITTPGISTYPFAQANQILQLERRLDPNYLRDISLPLPSLSRTAESCLQIFSDEKLTNANYEKERKKISGIMSNASNIIEEMKEYDKTSIGKYIPDILKIRYAYYRFHPEVKKPDGFDDDFKQLPIPLRIDSLIREAKFIKRQIKKSNLVNRLISKDQSAYTDLSKKVQHIQSLLTEFDAINPEEITNTKERANYAKRLLRRNELQNYLKGLNKKLDPYQKKNNPPIHLNEIKLDLNTKETKEDRKIINNNPTPLSELDSSNSLSETVRPTSNEINLNLKTNETTEQKATTNDLASPESKSPSNLQETVTLTSSAVVVAPELQHNSSASYHSAGKPLSTSQLTSRATPKATSIAPDENNETKALRKYQQQVNAININDKLPLILAKRAVLFKKGRENEIEREKFKAEWPALRRLREHVKPQIDTLEELRNELNKIRGNIDSSNNLLINLDKDIDNKLKQLETIQHQINDIEEIHRLNSEIKPSQIEVFATAIQEFLPGDNQHEFKQNCDAARNRLKASLDTTKMEFLDEDTSTGRLETHPEDRKIAELTTPPRHFLDKGDRTPLKLMNYENKALYYQGKEPTHNHTQYRSAVVVTDISQHFTRQGLLTMAMEKLPNTSAFTMLVDIYGKIKRDAAMRFWENYSDFPVTVKGLTAFLEKNKHARQEQRFLFGSIKSIAEKLEKSYWDYFFTDMLKFGKKLSDSFDNTAKNEDLLLLKGKNKETLYAVACYRKAMELITANIPEKFGKYDYIATDKDINPTTEHINRAKKFIEENYKAELVAELEKREIKKTITKSEAQEAIKGHYSQPSRLEEIKRVENSFTKDISNKLYVKLFSQMQGRTLDDNEIKQIIKDCLGLKNGENHLFAHIKAVYSEDIRFDFGELQPFEQAMALSILPEFLTSNPPKNKQDIYKVFMDSWIENHVDQDQRQIARGFLNELAELADRMQDGSVNIAQACSLPSIKNKLQTEEIYLALIRSLPLYQDPGNDEIKFIHPMLHQHYVQHKATLAPSSGHAPRLDKSS